MRPLASSLLALEAAILAALSRWDARSAISRSRSASCFFSDPTSCSRPETSTEALLTSCGEEERARRNTSWDFGPQKAEAPSNERAGGRVPTPAVSRVWTSPLATSPLTSLFSSATCSIAASTCLRSASNRARSSCGVGKARGVSGGSAAAGRRWGGR